MNYIKNAVQMETDVLVIGAGASGVGAALGARSRGLRVLLMDKGKLESAGCAGGGNDHYMAVLDEEGADDSLESLVKFYAKPLTGYTPAMIEKGWYNHMRPILLLLDKSGVKFGKTADGHFVRTQGFGQPGKWWCHISNGMVLKRRMAEIVHAHGVDVLNHHAALKILTDNGKACGALAWNVLTGEACIIRAKTVVSAQGRSATRSTCNSTNNPYNVWMYPYNTGGGMVLAYEAGAAITALDTYQRATMLPKGYGCPGMNGINSSGAYELSAMGERFMFKYDPMGENGIRNNQIQGTYQEQLEGQGPPFYMDMRHVPEDVVKELQFDLMPGDKATFGDWAQATETDFQHKPLEVEIGELIFGGQVDVNDNFETRVPGLFSGSIFLYCSGAMCGGYQAGLEAADKASGMNVAGQIDTDSANQVFSSAFAPLSCEETLTYHELEQAARNTMQYYMGYRRSEPGMLRALEKIRFLRSQAGRLHAQTLRDLMRCHESKEMLEMCDFAIQATIERRESGRCVYRRVDYPELNPEMNRPVILWQENGEGKIGWK